MGGLQRAAQALAPAAIIENVSRSITKQIGEQIRKGASTLGTKMRESVSGPLGKFTLATVATAAAVKVLGEGAMKVGAAFKLLDLRSSQLLARQSELAEASPEIANIFEQFNRSEILSRAEVGRRTADTTEVLARRSAVLRDLIRKGEIHDINRENERESFWLPFRILWQRIINFIKDIKHSIGEVFRALNPLNWIAELISRATSGIVGADVPIGDTHTAFINNIARGDIKPPTNQELERLLGGTT
jgi:hypothetical protein